MRSNRSLLLVTAVLLAAGCSPDQPLPTSTDPNAGIVEVAQGKYKSLVAFPLFSHAVWTNRSGPDAGFVSASGLYHAPIHMSGEREVNIHAEAPGFSRDVVVRVKPGPVTAADCLAPGQSNGGFGEYVFVEVLPEAITKVAPSYPDPARQAGVEGLVMVQAHVCACGQVDDVRVVHSIPLLDDAAVAAVRQWQFKPALSNNEAVAVWVGVPVKFSLH